MSVEEAVVSLGALQSIGEKELGLRPTRFDWIHVEPGRPVVGEVVKITAKIVYHEIPVICWWRPFAGRTVWLVIDDKKITNATTDGDGVASFTYVFPSKGIYAVKAVYEGEWDFSPSESTTMHVEVITEEQRREEERRFWLLVAGVGVAAVAVVGGVAWWVGESQRREMMMAALARR